MDWQTQIMQSTDSALSQMTQRAKEQNRRALLEKEKKSSGFDESVKTILKQLEDINDREEYTQVFGALSSDPEIQGIFSNSRYDFNSFKKTWNPDFRFGNEDLRQRGEIKKALQLEAQKAALAESPERKRRIIAEAKAEMLASRMVTPVYLMNRDTLETEQVSQAEAEERMKSPKRGNVIVMSQQEYEKPAYVFNVDTMEWEPGFHQGQLAALKEHARLRGVPFYSMSESEFNKQQVADSYRDQVGAKVTILGMLITRDLPKLKAKMASTPKDARVRTLNTSLARNTVGIGRSGNVTLSSLQDDLLDTYTKMPMELQGAKFYNPNTRNFEKVMDYRKEKAEVYAAWKALMHKKGPLTEEEKARLDTQERILSEDYSLGLSAPPSPFMTLVAIDKLLAVPYKKK